MVNRKYITREELVKLNNLLGSRRTGTDQQHLKDFWAFLAQKYNFHYYHTLIHTETGKIVDNCYSISRDDKKKNCHCSRRKDNYCPHRSSHITSKIYSMDMLTEESKPESTAGDMIGSH